MLLKDALQHRRIAAAIPNAVRINDSNRPSLADIEALRGTGQHAATLGQLQFLQPLAKKLIRLRHFLASGALLPFLVVAEQNMSLDPVDRQLAGGAACRFEMLLITRRGSR